MDKFATLEPVKLYSSAASTGARLLSRATGYKPHETTPPPLVGRLPSSLHLLILSHLPVPDIAAYSRCCRSTASFARDEHLWDTRWRALGIDTDFAFRKVLDTLERRITEKTSLSRAAAPPIIPVEDEFGDFAEASGGDGFVQPPEDEMGDFVGAFNNIHVQNIHVIPQPSSVPPKDTSLTKYIRAHTLLKPLSRILVSPPHVVLSDLAQQLSASLHDQAKLLRLLSNFLSPRIQPVRKWDVLYASLRTAMDRFDSSLLAAFDVSDGRGDEEGMREAAESSWEVWDGDEGAGAEDWEMGKVWAEKREIFYQQGRWDPLDNFTPENELNFAPMDDFIDTILHSLHEDGARATRVFPPSAQVLIAFADRLATEVVGEYITTLLSHARGLSNAVYLTATAAAFGEAWKMVDVIVGAAEARKESGVDRHKAEDVVYRMFEANMDEYLDEEVESVKIAFDTICKGWDREASSSTSPLSPTSPHHPSHTYQTQNPALLKRTVLASFTNILLLPVTIVPRTTVAMGKVVGGALMTGGSAAVQGIAMLNPQRWVGGGGGGVNGTGIGGGAGSGGGVNGAYSKDLEKTKVDAFFEDDEDDLGGGGGEAEYYPPTVDGAKERKSDTPAHLDLKSPTPLLENGSVTPSTAASTQQQPQQLDLLLSLDVALSLIHADRDSLKRVETFAGYPGHYGHRVRDTIEELFILMLRAIGEGHVAKGFARATEQMRDYKPGESSDTTNVAPLVQFFELVHIGDTIQSITQVYFEKELAHHIDKTDFMNPVVREKKRFENSLDDSVATGLNAGTEVLMNQVEHIILTLTKPREYYPPEDTPLELGPTKGCQEAIRCLENHCKLLKGSTSKEVLEVFYQEVGLRLIGILQKHIKRQIISLTGGFQVIADLNAYNAFIASLKVSAISAEFAHLRMLGHVYVVEDAKDLAQIVKDVARYGGAYRPEDIYEFIQRRSDWKKIEKVVDKTMYNLSFKEDCIVC